MEKIRKLFTIFGIVILTLVSSCQETSILATPDADSLRLWGNKDSSVFIKERLGNGPGYSLALSPDGKTIAVAGVLSVSTYDFNSLQENWTSSVEKIIPQSYDPRFHRGEIAWSPDGGQLATVSGFGVSVRDAKTGKLLHTFEERPYTLSSIMWAQDGRLIALGFNWEGTQVLLWEVQTGVELFNRVGVTAYAWAIHGNLLALELDHKEIIIWDILTNRQLNSPLKAYSLCCNVIIWSPDETQLASVDNYKNDQVIVSNVQTGKQLFMDNIQGVQQLFTMAWSPDNNYLAAAFNTGTIAIWDARTGKEIQTFSGYQAPNRDTAYINTIQSLGWSSDGKNLISLSQSGSIIVWNIKSGEKLRSLEEHTSQVNDVAWAPSGDMLASGSDDGAIIIWDPQSGKKMWSFHDTTGPVYSLTWSPDGKQLASGGSKITIWKVQNGKPLLLLPITALAQDAWEVIWSPDGSKLAVIANDGQESIWDVSTGTRLFSLEEYRFSSQIAWSPQGDLLGISSSPRSSDEREQITLWDLRTVKPILTQPDLFHLAWSPLGNILASESNNGTKEVKDDETLVLWDARTGKEIRKINLRVSDIDWSPDGNYLVVDVAQNGKQSIVVLNAETGEILHILKGHVLDMVRDIAWSPRGDLIASASYDGTVIIWKVDSH